jgi:hypothetical protein
MTCWLTLVSSAEYNVPRQSLSHSYLCCLFCQPASVQKFLMRPPSVTLSSWRWHLLYNIRISDPPTVMGSPICGTVCMIRTYQVSAICLDTRADLTAGHSFLGEKMKAPPFCHQSAVRVRQLGYMVRPLLACNTTPLARRTAADPPPFSSATDTDT